ncbi:MAG: aminomethyl-transferring glycine dehydrogenase subunit GcvPA [Solirubrobacterales bacterium]
MLDAVGVADVDELYAAIPERLRLRRPLELPPAVPSEAELQRELGATIGRNRSCEEVLSFLGGGCWQHYVPAVCDEVAQRAEFLSAYGGDPYTDKGKFQAFFEFASLIGELVELDAVALSTYDWGNAAATALRIAGRVTGGRRVVLCPRTTGPERLATITTMGTGALEPRTVASEEGSLLLDLAALEAELSEEVAAVYVEVPCYLGFVETRVAEIAERAHAVGALLVVGVDASSLGVIAPPPRYGADIVCGELQPLGIHMHHGGGLAGFVATPDEDRFVAEHPGFLIGIAPTEERGEYGFGYLAHTRTLYYDRDEGKDFTGTSTGLWAITAAVYLSLAGPAGMEELGRGIMQRSRYAAELLDQIPGVSVPALEGAFFKEFVVSFEGTGKSVEAVNRALRKQGVLGGHDISSEFPELGQSALYCVTEIHTRYDIDRLAAALAEATA